MFVSYLVQLLFRLTLLVIAVFLFITDPAALDVSALFGIRGGFNFVDFLFLALLCDFLTKFFVRAPISSGSLKQYRVYHIPTTVTFRGGRDALRAKIQEMADFGRQLIAGGRSALVETRKNLADRSVSAVSFARRLLNDRDFLRMFSFDKKDLSVGRAVRSVLYHDRMREVVPVIVFWVVFNAVMAIALLSLGVLDERTALLWSLGYFLFDMVCVVLWCPLQVLLMHNRCCTTCQIFNWDAIMVATPLVFVGGWFGALALVLALVILVRWELVALRHPERFDERTNARLTCAQCVDKLCYLRKPLENTAARIDLQELVTAAAPDVQQPGKQAPAES